MESNSINSKSTIDGIQYLRALAALMVVLFHSRLSVYGSDDWPTFGHSGVDIFFVISGFVMAFATKNINPNLNFNSRLSVTYEFLRKRFIRIYPLYFLGLVWISRRDISQGDFSMDLLKDFFFIPHPNMEYPGMLAPTLIQGWTLNYEMFFYLLFGVSLVFGKFRTIITVVSLLFLVSIGFYFQTHISTFNPSSFKDILFHFYTNNILIEFGLGIFAYKVFTKFQFFEISRKLLSLIAISAFIALAFLSDEKGMRGIMLGIPAFVIVVSISRLCVGFKLPFLNLLGDASYAIYLFHWSSFGATKPLVAYLSSSAGESATVAVLIISNFIVAVVSGIAIHLWIEKPLLNKIKHFGKTVNKNNYITSSS